MRGRIRTRLEDPAAVVGGIAAVALALRLVGLGGRVAHFDEGRVAYWALHFLETGGFHYRFIIHGPFVQHVNRGVFALLGANDFTMRLVVAAIGGLLPLAALLFRRHLDDVETVGLALLLAVNPVLLYYSRFFRSTVPVAAFMFVAFGCLVRAIDTRRPAYVHAAVVMTALGFAAKENAAVYLLVWLGAGLLSLDQALFRRDLDARVGRLWRTTLRPAVADRRRVARGLGHAALAIALFGGVIGFFYAPRAGATGGIGLWQGLADPARLPALVDATLADIRTGYEYWFAGANEPGCRKETVIEGYVCYLGLTLETLALYAGPLVALGVIGFFRERYAAPVPRRLVMVTGYWGFVSVLGYPLGTDIYGAWITVNAIVPLAVPAAVGGARFYTWGRDALAREDRTGTGLAAAVLLLLGAQTAGAAVSGVYLNPTADHNELVQYAQPHEDFRPALRQVEGVAPGGDGIDVLFFGDPFVAIPDPGVGMEPTCTRLARTLPLQWYVAMYDADAACAANATALDGRLADGRPAVVIAHERNREFLADRLEGYTARTYQLRTLGRPTVFFVDASRVSGGNRTAAVPLPPRYANP